MEPMAQPIELWPIDKFNPYARNPRKNDAAVDRMAASIQEFGFKIRYSHGAAAWRWTATFA